jgi:hypothetical protein
VESDIDDAAVEFDDSGGAGASAAGSCVDMTEYLDSDHSVDRFECKA